MIVITAVNHMSLKSANSEVSNAVRIFLIEHYSQGKRSISTNAVGFKLLTVGFDRLYLIE